MWEVKVTQTTRKVYSKGSFDAEETINAEFDKLEYALEFASTILECCENTEVNIKFKAKEN